MTTPSTFEEKLAFLRQHDADRMDHSSEDLLSHLHGTCELLRSWGARPALCDAGLFHSVYGTEVYPDAAVPLALRPVVRGLIGDEAEQLAYLFGVMERLSLYDNLYDGPPYALQARHEDARIPITEAEYGDLCTLTVANWLEQRPRFPPSQHFSRSREFQMMRPLLLPAAWAALAAAYGFDTGTEQRS